MKGKYIEIILILPFDNKLGWNMSCMSHYKMIVFVSIRNPGMTIFVHNITQNIYWQSGDNKMKTS
jgi:hypothetical protein